MIAAVLTLCLAVPIDSFDPPPLLDERPAVVEPEQPAVVPPPAPPVVIDPAGDPPPEPAPAPKTTPPPAPKQTPPPTTTTTTTPAPDSLPAPPALPSLDGFAVPAVMAGALVGGGGTAAVGLLFVASAHDVVTLGLADADSKAFSEVVGWALLASAPAFGGLIAGAVALLFLDGAGLDDWASVALCTTMAWVGTLAIVAVVALGFAGGGAGAGCNPNGCNPGGCGSCGNGCGSSSATNASTDDLMEKPANLVAAGAVFGAFAGGGIGAIILFASEDSSDPRFSLYLAGAAAAGAAIGAPIGAAIPAFGLD